MLVRVEPLFLTGLLAQELRTEKKSYILKTTAIFIEACRHFLEPIRKRFEL